VHSVRLTGGRVVVVVCRGGQVVKDQHIPRTMGWKRLYFYVVLLLIQVKGTRSPLDCRCAYCHGS
jgi:hypothetical protein